MDRIKSYKDLIVWQKSMNLIPEIYKLTNKFPKEELYVLSSQLRRTVISIVSNIAEGRQRGSRKDFIRFLTIAYGSGAELETQMEISKRLGYINDTDFTMISKSITEILKILNVMLSRLKYKS